MARDSTQPVHWLATNFRLLSKRVELLERLINEKITFEQSQPRTGVPTMMTAASDADERKTDECMADTLLSERSFAWAADCVAMQSVQSGASQPSETDSCIAGDPMVMVADCAADVKKKEKTDEYMVNTLMSEQPSALAATCIDIQADQSNASEPAGTDECIVHTLMNERPSVSAADCSDMQTVQSIASKPAGADKCTINALMSVRPSIDAAESAMQAELSNPSKPAVNVFSPEASPIHYVPQIILDAYQEIRCAESMLASAESGGMGMDGDARHGDGRHGDARHGPQIDAVESEYDSDDQPHFDELIAALDMDDGGMDTDDEQEYYYDLAERLMYES